MFTRDLVVFDVESTDLNIAQGEIIQIAAIRLDKDSLVEVARFSSYVQPQVWNNWLPEAMAVNKIPKSSLVGAPLIHEVLEQFEQCFPPSEVLLTAYNAWFDTGFVRQSYNRLGRHSPFEFHSFDIWALAYVYWCQEPRVANPARPIGFNLAGMAELLGITTTGQFHDALTDVEVEAEVLRRLLVRLGLHKSTT
jgi:DNA polymerase III alpha subunit (gram-positive type)